MTAGDGSTRALNLATAVVLAALAIVVMTLGVFRADDWTNLERGRLALSSEWRSVWTGVNPFSFYRPLVDLHHGVMLRLFGLAAGPHLAVLVGLLVLHTMLLRRIVALRGGPGPLAGVAVWAQANTWAWTTLWASNATGSLMATFWLLAMLAHHLAVDRAERHRPWVWAVLAACVLVPAAGLCKEEAVLLPMVLVALEATRWSWLGAPGRRAAVVSVLAIGLIAVGYAAFRLWVVPSRHGSGSYYGLVPGPQMLSNLAFFGMHLTALPLVALACARAFHAGAWNREAWRDPDFARARRGVLAGVAWAGIGITLYLPIGGHGYGYLYLPAFGIAFATAHGLDGTARLAARRARPIPAAAIVAAHAILAFAFTAWGLAASGWPRFRALEHDAFAVVDSTLRTPPPGAHVVFLDAGGSESLAGRSLFDLMFDDATGSMLRLHYGRDDLHGTVLRGDAALRAVEQPPEAAAVFVARRGRLTPVAIARPGARGP